LTGKTRTELSGPRWTPRGTKRKNPARGKEGEGGPLFGVHIYQIGVKLRKRHAGEATWEENGRGMGGKTNREEEWGLKSKWSIYK